MNGHNGIKPYAYTSGYESLTNKSNLKQRHIALCGNNNRGWKCATCDKTFKRKYNHDEHLESAHSEISFRCHCGKGFKWNTSLTRHTQKCTPIYIISD